MLPILAITSNSLPYSLSVLKSRKSFLASLIAQKSASTFFSITLSPLLAYRYFKYRQAYCIILQNLSRPSNIKTSGYLSYPAILRFAQGKFGRVVIEIGVLCSFYLSVDLILYRKMDIFYIYDIFLYVYDVIDNKYLWANRSWRIFSQCYEGNGIKMD